MAEEVKDIKIDPELEKTVKQNERRTACKECYQICDLKEALSFFKESTLQNQSLIDLNLQTLNRAIVELADGQALMEGKLEGLVKELHGLKIIGTIFGSVLTVIWIIQLLVGK